MLNTLGHNAQLCYAKCSPNAQHCTTLNLCINFSLLNNYAQFVVHVLYIKWKIVHKCTNPQQTCTIQMNNVLC